MTSSIKPPGSGPKPIDPVGASKDADRTDRTRTEAFDEALEAARAPATSATAPAGAVSGVVEDLRAGRIDAAAAVDRLVADVLNGPMAAGLDDRGRAALEAHLRASLEDDPNLAALVRDLER
ncbi:MAG: hypothetical protein H6722_22080 [Sandaracinus sp.]|nr:hypothetical protein [Myxococcales bacterium]MCB9601573.1 hypothetical protein [Sandaracinus sp.]MCB9615137.1 hypothetical protein [Sandaracinus sp.]